MDRGRDIIQVYIISTYFKVFSIYVQYPVYCTMSSVSIDSKCTHQNELLLLCII